MTATDEKRMRRAIALAATARDVSPPNPWVGCLIEPGGIEGATQAPGGPHAEAVALRAAGARARGTTLYTTLEPCSHYGRTPPCADAIVDAGVTRVVVGLLDPDARVGGRGIERLRAAGVDVAVDICGAEVKEQLQAYLTHRTLSRPWIVETISADHGAGRSSPCHASVTFIEELSGTNILRVEIAINPPRAAVLEFEGDVHAVLADIGRHDVLELGVDRRVASPFRDAGLIDRPAASVAARPRRANA